MPQTTSTVSDRSRWALAVMPVLLLLVTALIAWAVGRRDVDPDYAYLLNGLEILTLHPPSYFDHPGTTLEVLAALVTFITWLISLPVHGFTGLVTSVIAHPDIYLYAINQVLVVIIAGACFYMATQILTATKSLLASLVAQASVFLSFCVPLCLYRVMPEPLLLGATLTLTGLLAPLVFRPELLSAPRRHAALLGAAIGFCIATKITALPLIFSVLLLEDRALRRVAVFWIIAAGFLLTLPILHHYPAMLSWFLRVFSHRGDYGSGTAGAPSAQNLWTNLLTLLQLVPEMFVALLVYGLVLLLSPTSRVRRLMTVSIIVLSVQVLMVIKQPSARYLLPSVAIMALANAGLAWDLWNRRERGAWKAILAMLFAFGLVHNAWETSSWASQFRQVNEGNDKLAGLAQNAGCVVIPYYEVMTPIYGLDFGNYYTHDHFTAALQRLYPSVVTYDAFHKSFRQGFSNASLGPAALRARFSSVRCVYMLGLRLEKFGASPFAPDSISVVAQAPYGSKDGLTLYELHPAKLPLRP